jgi:hypothetical protein
VKGYDAPTSQATLVIAILPFLLILAVIGLAWFEMNAGGI